MSSGYTVQLVMPDRQPDPRAELARLRERIRAAIEFHRRRGYQPTDSYTVRVLRELLEGK